MSQITRCPSCGTTFKVVADQLRISDGWVRCGQCKDVFDAAAHLVVIETVQLLPEMRFDGLRTGPAEGSATPPAAPVRVWGSARTPPSAPPSPSNSALPPPTVPVGRDGAPVDWSAGEPGARGRPDPSLTGVIAQKNTTGLPSVEVPPFLATSASVGEPSGAQGWSLEPQSPYGWTTRAPAVPHTDVVPELSQGSSAVSSGASQGSAASATPEPGGYELPFAQLRDSEWPEDLELEVPAQTPEVERPLPVLSDVPPPELPGPEAGIRPGLLIAPSADSAAQANDDSEQEGDSLPAALGAAAASPRLPLPQRGPHAAEEAVSHLGDDDGPEAPGADEPSFVRTARRQAFWSSPTTRAMLALCVLGLAALLLAQVAVRERDALAARHPGLRGTLEVLCGPWQCSLAPPRRIADVVIDSSSFTRGRTDTYLLSMTIKNNNADTAVAMPAVELTLTDAQDQPLLRKVLQAGEIAAPRELSARGEWSGAFSLNVADVGSRVAGYRLLAFYP